SAFFQPLVFEHRDIELLEHLAKYRFRDLRLGHPCDVLQVPVELVLLAGPPIELERKSADHFATTDVSSRKSAADHSADMSAGIHQRDAQTVPRAGDCGHHTTSRPTVDDQIIDPVLRVQS